MKKNTAQDVPVNMQNKRHILLHEISLCYEENIDLILVFFKIFALQYME